MYRYRILTIAAACLCIFNSLQAVSGPERLLPGRIQPAPGEQMGIGDDGPHLHMPDTLPVVPSLSRPATPAPSRPYAAPTSHTHARQKLSRSDRHAPRLAHDPATLRHGWISWVALVAGVASIAAMLAAILVGVFLWEYMPVLVLIWAVGALIALIFGAVALGVDTIKHRKVGIAGFVLGGSSIVLPFLILIGLVMYSLLVD